VREQTYLILTKARRGDYWWNDAGHVSVRVEDIESVEEMRDHTAGGAESACGSRVVMRTGTVHVVREMHDKVLKLMDDAVRGANA
jgi:hypothetical protein